MIGRTISVDTATGPVSATVTPRVAIAFERQFKRGIIPAITEDRRMEHLYWLMWEAIRSSGTTVPPFDKWCEQVTGFVTVDEEEALPLEASSSTSPTSDE